MKKSKLILIPYAGGNQYSYLGLKKILDTNIEMITLELPGHGKRIFEPLLESVLEILEDLIKQIAPHLTGEYMIWGHSMGGMLGNLLIHELEKNGLPLPKHCVITGCMSPKYHGFRGKKGHLSDDEFVAELTQLGGMPKDVLENKDLMDFVLPIIRADFRAIENYVYHNLSGHLISMTVIAGTDENINDLQLFAWQEATKSSCELSRLKGDHFFIFQHLETIAQVVYQKMNENPRMNIEKLPYYVESHENFI
jgi:surfactin synthase thioesterase subunit